MRIYPSDKERTFVLLDVRCHLGAVAETHKIPIDFFITGRPGLLFPAAEAFPKRGEQILDLPIIDRRGSSDPILLGMVLGPGHGRLGSWQIVLLEVLELLMIEPAHVLGSEHAFLEYISFHRGKSIIQD